MVQQAKPKGKKIKLLIIGTLLLVVIVGGAVVYNSYYSKTYKFKGLGDIYEVRNSQYKLFHERKITYENKGTPPKEEIKQLPSFKSRINTNLSDGSYLSISLDLRFANAKGIKEAREKWERINFAITLALSAYSGKELQGQYREEALLVIENQIRKRIFSKIEYIYLDNIDLRG